MTPPAAGRPSWLPAALFLCWAWLLFFGSGFVDRSWSARMLDQMLDPAQYAAGFAWNTLGLWAGYAGRIVLAASIFFSARALGRRALDFLGAPEDLTGAHRTAWETALGLGGMCALWLGLGLVGLYRPWVAWLVLASGAAWGARDLAERLRPDRSEAGASARFLARTLTRSHQPRGALAWFCGATLLASLLLNALTLLCPEGFYDTLVYHLGVPRAYLLHGGLGVVPFNAHQHTIGYWHMLYVWGLLLSDEVFCKVLHAGAGLLMVSAVVTGAPASGSAGWIGGLLIGTAPVVCLAGWPAAAEMPVALFGALCGLAAIRAASSDAPTRWARLAGVAGGLALGTKLTGGLAVGAGVAILLIARAWRPAAILAGLAGAVASPWFLKNVILTGNPVFPYLGSVFGLGGYDPADAARFIAATQEGDPIRNPWTALQHLWALSLGGVGAVSGLFLGPAFLLLAPVSLFTLAPKGGEGRVRGLYVLIALAAWLSVTRQARFFLPALPVLAVLLGAALDQARGGLRVAAVSGVLFACWFNLYDVAKITYFASGGMRVTLGLETPEAFLNSGHVAGYTAPSHGLMMWANRNLPRDAVILCLGEPRAAYLQRRFIAPSVYDHQPLADWVRASPDEAGVAARFMREGVTHLLVNDELLRREGVERLLPLSPAERARFDGFAARHLSVLHREGAAVLYRLGASSGIVSKDTFPKP